MTFQGKITYISPKTEGTSQAGNAWAKVDIVVTESGTNYPNELLVTAMNDRLDQFKGIKVGDMVTVDYDLRVREYNGRRYQNASLYKITKVEAAETATAPAPATEKAVKATAYMEAATANPKPAPVAGNVFDVNPKSTAGDDLPF